MNSSVAIKLSIAAWCYSLSVCCVADTFVSDEIILPPTPQKFSICHDHTCTRVSPVSLSSSQWQQVRHLFIPVAQSNRQERNQLKLAIAKLETYVGAQTGTADDKGENLKGVGEEGQLDCIDESTNTSIYLMLLQQDGLMTRHRVQDRETRGFLPFSWPHTTAVISEVEKPYKKFAVDSWFRDNGFPPFIVPLETWEDGWRPGGQ